MSHSLAPISITDEAVLKACGSLTVEQFLQQEAEKQIAAVLALAAERIEDFRRQAEDINIQAQESSGVVKCN